MDQRYTLLSAHHLSVEIPITAPGQATSDIRKAAEALERALASFRRGSYREAVSECRPGLEALVAADAGRFSLKHGDRAAGKDERFGWVQQSLLKVAHLAHHPNEEPPQDGAPQQVSWSRADAEAVIAILATLVRQRTGGA